MQPPDLWSVRSWRDSDWTGIVHMQLVSSQNHRLRCKALEQSALSPVEQQVVTLVVSATNDWTYCVGAHSTVAQMVRMPEDVLDALRAQRPRFDRKLDALCTF